MPNHEDSTPNNKVEENPLSDKPVHDGNPANFDEHPGANDINLLLLLFHLNSLIGKEIAKRDEEKDVAIESTNKNGKKVSSLALRDTLRVRRIRELYPNMAISCLTTTKLARNAKT